MSNKYIIRNCSAISKHHLGHWNCTNGIQCQDCTDCVMKQIVELCEPVKKEYLKHKLDALIAGQFNIAGKILLKLDIEECE